MLEILKPDFLLHHAVYGSVVVGLVCPLVGVHLVLRRLVLWAVALPQVSTAGISCAFLLQALGVSLLAGGSGHEHHLAIAGSVAFTAAATLTMAWLESRGRGLGEGRLGALYAAAWAASILFVATNAVGETEMLGLLKGEIVAISESDFHAMLNTFAVVGAAMLLFRREFTFCSYDRDMAVSLGRRAWLWDLLLSLLVSVTISLGVMTVGPLVIFGMLVLPPMAAQPWAKGMTGFSLLASALGGLSGVAGFYVSYTRDLPLGPVIVAVASAVLLLSGAARRLLRPGR
jgi:ABC-type Mn2+/Zn2+ transport system permease subunit